MLDLELLPDGEDVSTSGINFLIIHVILKALEDYYNEDDSDDAQFHKGSAELFFAGYEETSNYRLYLSIIGWDVDEFGVIPPERWYDVIESQYASISEAKPKIGMSTRLIPKDTELWQRIRRGRNKREID